MGLVSSVICMIRLSPPVAIHGLLCFPAGILVTFVLAAVPRLFALGQGDFDLGNAVAEINPQGNDGQTFCRFHVYEAATCGYQAVHDSTARRAYTGRCARWRGKRRWAGSPHKRRECWPCLRGGL